jgi:S1-C subfamily serine protease
MLGLPADAKGAVVTEVERNSRAAKAGLVPEDVIVEINRKPVADTEGAVAALKAGAKGSLLLKIRRGQTSRFVTIPAP